MPEKKLLLGSQGYKVYEVDGEEVREDVSVTFSGGDNWAHNEKIPKNEIWLEAGKSHGDAGFILLHEIVEAVLTSEKDMDYDEAHCLANVIEGFARKTGDLAEALAVLGEAAELPEADIKKINGLYAAFEGSEKKAEVSAPVWRGADPDFEPPVPPARDPYEDYLTGALGSESRRGRMFDLATGTRWKGLRGVKDRLMSGMGEYGAMLGAGVKPWDKDFESKVTSGVKKTLDNDVNVDKLFGRRMRPLEAISTLGVTGLAGIHSMASDPMTWAKAFGNAAKTPVERAKARKSLHAALSLRDLKNGVSFDPKKLQLLWAGLGEGVQKQYRMQGTTRDTPYGSQQLPSIKDIMGAPVLNPKYYPDTEQAADLMAKMSSDEPRAKIASELKVTGNVAKFKLDPEDHLYHVEKRDGKTVGMVKVAPKDNGTRYHITNFWVKPGMRSQGIGKALFKRVIELYGDKELTLDSEVFDKSPLSQKALDSFYEKHGFTKGEGLRMTRPAGGAQEKAAGLEDPRYSVVVAPVDKKHFAGTTRPLDKMKPGIGVEDTWSLPGGHIDPGETPLQTALREANEEGWDLEGLNENPVHKGMITLGGKPPEAVWWFEALKAKMREDYKEKHRLRPILVKLKELQAKKTFGDDLALAEHLRRAKEKTAAMKWLSKVLPSIVKPVAQAAPHIPMPQAPVGREILLSRIISRLRSGAPGHYQKLQEKTLRPHWARRAQEGLQAAHGDLQAGRFAPAGPPKLSADNREQLSRLWVKLAGLRTIGQLARSLRDPFTTGALSRSAMALGHRGVDAGGGLGKAMVGASRAALPVARGLEAVPEVISKLPGSLRSYAGNKMFDLRDMYQRLRGRQTPMRSMRLEAQRNKFNDSLPDQSWVERLTPGPKLAPTTPAQHAELNKIDYRTTMTTGGAPSQLTYKVNPAERARMVDDYRRKNLAEYIRYHNRYQTTQSLPHAGNVVPQARTETFAMTPRIGPFRPKNVVPQARTDTFTLPPPIRGITI